MNYTMDKICMGIFLLYILMALVGCQSVYVPKPDDSSLWLMWEAGEFPGTHLPPQGEAPAITTPKGRVHPPV